MTIIDGVYKALGEELTRLHGHVSTRLVAPLPASGVVALVESTIEFPDVGVLYVEGERIPYTGRGLASFTGLVRDPHRAVLHPQGVELADGSRSFSRIDEARADRLVTRAEGWALDRFGRDHGEQRPLALDDEAYRALLRVLLYLERGLWWSLYRVLAEITAAWTRTGTAGTNPATPQRLTAAPGTFSDQDRGRPLVARGLVHRIREVAAGGDSVDLQPTRGPWWCAGNWGDGDPAVPWSIPPFRILELPDLEPGIVVVDLFLPASRLPLPSYLLDRDPALPTDPELTPVGWPFGHQVLTDELDPGSGWGCWYLPGLPDDDALLVLLEEVVPAGVDVRLATVAAP